MKEPEIVTLPEQGIMKTQFESDIGIKTEDVDEEDVDILADSVKIEVSEDGNDDSEDIFEDLLADTQPEYISAEEFVDKPCFKSVKSHLDGKFIFQAQIGMNMHTYNLLTHSKYKFDSEN